jgi:hypothetical protein
VEADKMTTQGDLCVIGTGFKAYHEAAAVVDDGETWKLLLCSKMSPASPIQSKFKPNSPSYLNSKLNGKMMSI